jgi:signal transduction histidine kinase
MNPTRVLIVDDEPGFAAVLAASLEDAGWHIMVATSGEEALRIMQEEPVDVLASDYLMPDGMDGAELVNKALAVLPNLYSIIFTGWGERDAAIQALRAGVAGFLDKGPRLDEELEPAIRRGIQMVTLTRLGRQLLETDRENDILDLLIDSLDKLGRFHGCCIAILKQEQGCRVERAIDLQTGETYGSEQLDQADSAYRYVIEEQTVYLPPLFEPAGRELRPYFETSHSIAVVPLTVKGEPGALGIEHRELNRFGVEDIRILRQIGQWVTLAFDRLHQQQERVRLERKIAEGDQGDLARAALHEIRNPLNNLAFVVQEAADELSGESKRSLLDNISRINGALTRINQFIRKKNVRENVVVSQVVRDAVFRFEELYVKPAVEKQISSALPMIVGDHSRLVSAIVNLLQNGATATASKFDEARLTIRADYAPARDQVEILVTDNGPGIASQHLDRIFDYAYTTREHEGHTGYGLAFVKDVVENCGGRVSVDTADGRGATFKLSFPAGTVTSQEAQAEAGGNTL